MCLKEICDSNILIVDEIDCNEWIHWTLDILTDF